MIGIDLGVVVIGRNEGERLMRCFDSCRDIDAGIVYVDSGSTDGSPEHAVSRGVPVEQLDMAKPFTAARARNAGFAKLTAGDSAVCHVQFVDGDCELAAGWLNAGRNFLVENPDVAAVHGRLRERYPTASVYNLQCDCEWVTPVGPAPSFGGLVMLRAAAFSALGGFNEALIAGEEPELAVRLRAAGWKIHRIDAEMALHDANIMRFGQWWRRTVRAGHAFAEGAALHGATAERHWVREVRSARFWTLGVLGTAALLAALAGPAGLLLLLLYPLQVVRLALGDRSAADFRLTRAALLVLGKFAEMQGQLRYRRTRRRGRASTLIEYK